MFVEHVRRVGGRQLVICFVGGEEKLSGWNFNGRFLEMVVVVMKEFVLLCTNRSHGDSQFLLYMLMKLPYIKGSGRERRGGRIDEGIKTKGN